MTSLDLWTSLSVIHASVCIYAGLWASEGPQVTQCNIKPVALLELLDLEVKSKIYDYLHRLSTMKKNYENLEDMM